MEVRLLAALRRISGSSARSSSLPTGFFSDEELSSGELMVEKKRPGDSLVATRWMKWLYQSVPAANILQNGTRVVNRAKDCTSRVERVIRRIKIYREHTMESKKSQ